MSNLKRRFSLGDFVEFNRRGEICYGYIVEHLNICLQIDKKPQEVPLVKILWLTIPAKGITIEDKRISILEDGNLFLDFGAKQEII